jgi:hypothetical protein
MRLFSEDLLFLVFEVLKNDTKSLYSCLLVNRIWCATAVPILWRNPNQICMTKYSKNILYRVLISHLSEESRDILKNHGINNLVSETYQRPLFNYISFWKYLELDFLRYVISSKIDEKSYVLIIRNEILKLFIKHTKLNHFSIPSCFDYKLHLIPGAECCVSRLESFSCYNDIAQNLLEGLAGICKSIKKLTLYIMENDNDGIIKLIEVQKNLRDFRLFNISFSESESFYKSIEKSLIKHADTVQHLGVSWNLTTKFLSYFVNLTSLEIEMQCYINSRNMYWNDPNYLKNLSLPILKILKVRFAASNVLVNLIENTKGNLTEINIYYDGGDSKDFIRAIYKNCSKLKYLKLSLTFNTNSLISEFENLLINCQYLNGLFIGINSIFDTTEFKWDELFKILTQSSPISLFKFKFYTRTSYKLEDLKSFFDNWRNRKSLLLKIADSDMETDQKLVDLIEQYKAKGIIEKYFHGICAEIYEDFEWI